MISAALFGLIIFAMGWALMHSGLAIKGTAEQTKQDFAQTPLTKWLNKQLDAVGDAMISLSYLTKMLIRLFKNGIVYIPSKNKLPFQLY